MSRWEPNARGRLEQAALELYRERGFDQTTVAEIAKRAGLTERTFFRHYTDKREVLFGSGTQGGAELQALLVKTLADAPAGLTPIDTVAFALEAAGTLMQERRAAAQQRHAIVSGHAELRERELIKLAALSAAIGEALRARGVAEPAASLAAETGIAVFRISFERWLAATGSPELATVIHESFQELKAVAAQ
ncbi:TetR family transcriptional regulator [Amycolatopsis sp.]|uniref:TetR family transcriptional regulator n=1 Tax=Amycolatopsis sp. TaxID=37632 RepID=UPI002CBAA02C|nr:TetR family transcriptional regulator [Amycolatopsis sp.]HVV08748.1 TetR family transcriptional regulator [Amycolatopsis sp.]